MATVNPTIVDLDGSRQVIKFTWALTSANTDGAPIPPSYAEYADRTVYFLGTWGGATAVWQGGDGSTWLTLTDAQTTAISKTADGIETVVETPEYSRPNLTVPGAGATITVTCIARRGYKRGY
jgi:hypothetical protein